MKAFLSKRIWLLAMGPAALLLMLLGSLFPGAVEAVYSRGFYAVFSRGMNFITGFFPFSVAEIGVYVLLTAAGAWMVRQVILFAQSREKKAFAARVFIKIVSFLCAAVFAFTLCCGLNYYRYPFSHHSELTVTASTADELAGLCGKLVEKANTLRGELSEDENGVMTLPFSFAQTDKKARKALSSLAQKYPVLSGNYSRAKPVMCSKLMSSALISGIFTPFTFEANVNTGTPPCELPHTIAHELSHLYGFMREEDANYIGYLACMESSDPYLQYSGVFTAFSYVHKALYQADPALWEEATAPLSEPVRRDIRAANAYWFSYKGSFSSFASSVNDAYLKMNQQDGVQSYGYFIDLLLAEYRKEDKSL